MPTYTYKCNNCGQEVDKIVDRKKKDNPDLSCSNCGSDSFERKLSAPTQINNEMSNHSNQHSCPGGSCGI